MKKLKGVEVHNITKKLARADFVGIKNGRRKTHRNR